MYEFLVYRTPALYDVDKEFDVGLHHTESSALKDFQESEKYAIKNGIKCKLHLVVVRDFKETLLDEVICNGP